ncbi:uncharacterized protein L969DRAFT_20253 [Mixia osmundae IAM 14324]|uniref:Uncharacterized protein n=1 Tax=Mixia osmundae (strain CBS 9802 / IAM 14324 / JCM 22182 / KY 12970) TaxID=764103 RepID=G7DWA1_MIXOS|nr:uncharacterized protein L969DRAFT_20253 [Mixia osmundae IAM 14324]KEI36511.1 hypothetical protein L969DRAFT_20253 [Mixia osmundae IAM 14324]GAA94789.1 hypothetical protein E5Q_01443 [Mixia osmundae IAM 14324]
MIETLTELARGSQRIGQLHFRQTGSFDQALALPSSEFEHVLLREALPHERSLFARTAQSIKAAPKIPPIEARDDQPEVFLQAAATLLSLYPLPSATLRLNELCTQYNALANTINKLEAELAQPRATTSKIPADHLVLEASVLKVETEIMTLKDAITTKQRQARAKQMSPVVPPKSPARPPRAIRPVPAKELASPIAPDSPVRPAAATTAAKPATPTAASPAKAPSLPTSPVRKSPARAQIPASPGRKSFIPDADIQAILNTIWTALGDVLRSAAGPSLEDADTKRNLRTTLPLLAHIAGGEPTATAPANVMIQAELLRLLLSSLGDSSSSPPAKLIENPATAKKHAWFEEPAVKSLICEYGRTKGVADDQCHRQIYHLVSRKVLQLNRRARPNLIGFS